MSARGILLVLEAIASAFAWRYDVDLVVRTIDRWLLRFLSVTISYIAVTEVWLYAVKSRIFNCEYLIRNNFGLNIDKIVLKWLLSSMCVD